MKTTAGYSSGSRILQRVRRHAEITTLWQPPVPTQNPLQTRFFPETPSAAGLPEMQPDFTSLDEVEIPAVEAALPLLPPAQAVPTPARPAAIPETQPAAAYPPFQAPAPAPVFPSSPPVPPAPPALPAPPAPPAPIPVQRQVEPQQPASTVLPAQNTEAEPELAPSGAWETDRSWQRLQAIFAAHREKQASDVLESARQENAPAPIAAQGGENISPEHVEKQPNVPLTIQTPAPAQPTHSRPQPASPKIVERNAPVEPEVPLSQSPPRTVPAPRNKGLAQRDEGLAQRDEGPVLKNEGLAQSAAWGLAQTQTSSEAPPVTLPPLPDGVQPASMSGIQETGEQPASEILPTQPVGAPPRVAARPTQGTGFPELREMPAVEDFPQQPGESISSSPPGYAAHPALDAGVEISEQQEGALAPQPVPLQAAWPVLQRESSENTPGENISGEDREEGAPAGTSKQEETTPLRANLYAAGQPVEALPPRRPRPGILQAAPFHPLEPPGQQPASAVDRQQPAPPITASETAPPGMVQTSIGPLPADLWELVGEKAPSHPASAGVGAPAAQAFPATETGESSESMQAWMESSQVAAPRVIQASRPVETEPAPAQDTEGEAAQEPAETQETGTPAQPGSSTAEAGQPQDADLANLVRQVYSEIRRRLAIEWERSRR